MRRQGLVITIKDLINLTMELSEEEKISEIGIDINRRFQVNIINKTKASDTWELELSRKIEDTSEGKE